jgi:hypothetical protein
MAVAILCECLRRQMAERCIKLAKTCTEPRVAEQLLTFAANHLEKAELALQTVRVGTRGSFSCSCSCGPRLG